MSRAVVIAGGGGIAIILIAWVMSFFGGGGGSGTGSQGTGTGGTGTGQAVAPTDPSKTKGTTVPAPSATLPATVTAPDLTTRPSETQPATVPATAPDKALVIVVDKDGYFIDNEKVDLKSAVERAFRASPKNRPGRAVEVVLKPLARVGMRDDLKAELEKKGVNFVWPQ